MYGARSTRFWPAHQAQIAAPNGSSCLTKAIAAITGIRNCSSDAAEHRHESAERREDDVAGLVEDEVGQVQERIHRIGADRRARELQRPDREPGDERGARPVRRRSFVRRRREDREDQQAAAAGVADAVRDAFGRDQQIAGLHRQLAAFEQEQPFAFDHLVDLVLPGVRVQRVFLAGLERIQARPAAAATRRWWPCPSCSARRQHVRTA